MGVDNPTPPGLPVQRKSTRHRTNDGFPPGGLVAVSGGIAGDCVRLRITPKKHTTARRACWPPSEIPQTVKRGPLVWGGGAGLGGPLAAGLPFLGMGYAVLSSYSVVLDGATLAAILQVVVAVGCQSQRHSGCCCMFLRHVENIGVVWSVIREPSGIVQILRRQAIADF